MQFDGNTIQRRRSATVELSIAEKLAAKKAPCQNTVDIFIGRCLELEQDSRSMSATKAE
jgi:hypothetical protein